MRLSDEALSKEFLEAVIGSALLVAFIGAVYFIQDITAFIKQIF